jgi:hypothetical protein
MNMSMRKHRTLFIMRKIIIPVWSLCFCVFLVASAVFRPGSSRKSTKRVRLSNEDEYVRAVNILFTGVE